MERVSWRIMSQNSLFYMETEASTYLCILEHWNSICHEYSVVHDFQPVRIQYYTQTKPLDHEKSRYQIFDHMADP